MKQTMKKRHGVVSLVLAGALAVSSASWAHGGGKPGGHQGMAPGLERFYHLSDVLDMTDAQDDALRQIIEDARESMKDVHEARALVQEFMSSAKPSDEDYASRLNALADQVAAEMRNKILLMGQVRQKIDAILTDEQREKLARVMEKHEKRRERHMRRQDF